MRIITGSLKGRRIEGPKNKDIRPTSDRTRESIFNILEHGIEQDVVRGGRVLDLCCGTGALGLEALSRGAEFATFVDNAGGAIALVKENIGNLGMRAKSEVIQANMLQLPTAKQPVTLVLMDPPYIADMLEQAYATLKSGGWIKKGSILVAEQSRKSDFPEIDGLELLKLRKYGQAKIAVFEVV